MIIELHVLQNFAPANLNRDDTGAPKDCIFGGYPRARISSQCFKRAMRTEFRQARLMPDAQMAKRTVLAQGAIAERLVKMGHDNAEAQAAARVALQAIGIKMNAKEPDKTSYLLFLSPPEFDAVARIVHDQWETFQVPVADDAEESATGGGRGKKKATAPQVPSATAKALESALDGSRAADLALFGRMIADLPERNVEAACQVAHAISTHRVDTEFDFYTAVDDLKPDATTGAGMLGVVEFNSACFYRYANLDTRQLAQNLKGDGTLVQQTVAAFVQAMVYAVPTGKQNSMAAHNPPSLVLAVVRERGQWNLANAFVQPVAPRHDADLVVGSVKALDDYWGKLVGMYGTQGLRGCWVATMEGNVHSLRDAQVASFAALTEQVLAHVEPGDQM